MKKRGLKVAELHEVGFNQVGKKVIAEIWECPFCKKHSTFKISNTPYVNNKLMCIHAKKAVREKEGVYFNDDFNIKMEIVTYDKHFVFDFMGKTNGLSINEIQIRGQAILRHDETIIHKGVSIPDIVKFTLIIPTDIVVAMVTNVIANWIYDRLKGKKIEKIVIERKEIELNADEIKRVLEEKITLEKK